MAIDTSIYGQIKPIQIENPLTQFAQVQAIQQGQNQNRLAELAFGEKQRELAETNRANALYADAVMPDGTIDRKKLVAGFAQGGLGSKLPGIQKQFAESDKATADLDKTRFEVAEKRFKTYQTVTGSLAQDPALNKGMVLQAGQQLVQMGVLPASVFESASASLPDDPTELRQVLLRTAKSQLTPEQMFTVFAPKPTEVSNGQQKFFTDTNPNSPTFGQMVGGAPVQMRMTPGEVATDARGKEANRLKQEEIKVNEKGIVGKKVQDVEMKLADDYRVESKGFAETSTAMKKILGAIETADKNPGSALSAGTAFMKLLDPNSVVRESELGMALNASGWFDRATNIANTLQSGRVMTETQKKNLKQAAVTLFEEAKSAQREIDASFTKRATDYGADAKRVIVDRGQNAKIDAGRSVVQTGIDKKTGRKVVKYSDGTIDYAN